MKKIMIFAAFAAALSLASCKKDGLDVTNNGESSPAESPVFTAEISQGFKTTIVAATGVVSWEMDDEITVEDNAGKSAKYKISSIDETTGRATFVIKEGETAIGAGPYKATYREVPATEQEYCETPGKLYMIAESNNKNLQFKVQCGLLEIKLTRGEDVVDESVYGVAVTGTPTGGSEATYTMAFEAPREIAEGKTFYIAVPVPVGIDNKFKITKFEITNGKGKVCTVEVASGIEVAANDIKPISIKIKDNSKFSYPGVLPGLFSVSATKTVYFSNGNLFADSGNVLHFEENQRYIRYNNASHKSLFTWSSTLGVALGGSRSGDHLFCDESNKISVENSGNIFYALSKDEWVYLFKTREVKGGTGKGYSYSVNIDYNGKVGTVLYPDGYTGVLISSKSSVTELPKGVVFLPAAGQRSGTSLTNENYGSYLSSTPVDEAISKVYRVKFQTGSDTYDVSPENEIPTSNISYGYSLRLVVTNE